MNGISRTGALLALALTAGALGVSVSEPAHAACTVQGIPYRVMQGGIGDPTGPVLYIKTAPEESFYYFIRFRDGRSIERIEEHLGEAQILVSGDAVSCPVEGIVRDMGTALNEVTVLQSAARSSAP